MEFAVLGGLRNQDGHIKLIILIAIGASVLLFRLTSLASKRLRLNRKAALLGCGSIPLERTKWPLGIDMILKLLEADQKERTPDFVSARYEIMRPAHTWRSRILMSEYIVTADPQNVQAILATQFSDFALGASRRGNMRTVLGRNIFAVDGEAWARAREVLRPLFTRAQVSDLALAERHFQQLLRCIPLGEIDAQGWTKAVSLAQLFSRFTLDSSTELFLGRSVNSLHALSQAKHLRRGEGDTPKDFQWAFDRVQQLIGKRLRFRSFYWLVGNRELKECVGILHAFVDEVIADVERSKAGLRQPLSTRYDLLKELAERCNDSNEIRDHVLGILGAGRDTTAALTSWVFYSLIRNQNIFNKLRGIVLETFGAYSKPDISFEKLKGCRYLQHVLNETLRLHSVVPFNSRCALRDTTLPTGGGPNADQPVLVPKGTEVNFSSHVMHRRHDLWGSDADQYVPERWESLRPGWKFVPWSGGPRLCLGQQLALTDAGFVIVRMLQRFDAIEGVDVDMSRDWHHFTIIAAPGPGKASVKARLHVAD